MPSGLQFARGLMALVLFGAAVEVCARIDDAFTYGAPFLATYNSDSLYTKDRIGKRGKPYGRYRKWFLNALGFRGPDLKPGGTRILCFGASETFGLYEAEGMEYPRQLEAMLNRRAGGERYQVVNTAYAGLSPLTASLRVPEMVAAIRPSLALIYPVPADYIRPPVEVAPAAVDPPEWPQPFELRIQDRVHWLLKGILPEGVQTFLREREIARDTAGVPVMDRLPEANVERFRQDVLKLASALRERGVTPILLTHLNAFGATPAGKLSLSQRRQLTSWRKFYPTLAEEGFLDMEERTNQQIRALGAQENIPVIDLASMYSDSPRNFYDFVHFSDEGARQVAGLLAAHLQPALQSCQKR